MRILYIGHNYSGSNARSLFEAFVRLFPSEVDDIGMDLFLPRSNTGIFRIANRILRPYQKADLQKFILGQVDDQRPDFVLVYKGAFLDSEMITAIKAAGPKTVLIFPDYSPHAYDRSLRKAVGAYDLVCSTKPFHPALWKSVYGYENQCVFVPHGYCPNRHYSDKPIERPEFDVMFIGNGRPEYYELFQALAARVDGEGLRVAIAGPNWTPQQVRLPDAWARPGPRWGLGYREWLRKAKIAIAPLNTRVVINGVVQPGDVDTSRTYSIPAANCFCIHRRTDFVKALYDEETEMPMFDDADELAEKIVFYSRRDELRQLMTTAAHARTVPAHSTDARAAQIVEHLETL
jgi:spore maturation protein CgeB